MWKGISNDRVEQLSVGKCKFCFLFPFFFSRYAFSQKKRLQWTISLVFALNVEKNEEHLVKTIVNCLQFFTSFYFS